MNLPKKCGNMYIKFDKNNNPEYGFEIEERGFNVKKYYIKKFILLCDKHFDTIILPKLIKETLLPTEIIKEFEKHPYHKSNLEKYLIGEVRICDKCFNNIKDMKIVVPFTGSIAIDWGSFDEDANIEFVTDQKLSLKQVYRLFDTGFDYERENWTLIADKEILFDITLSGGGYSVQDYKAEDLRYTVANFKLSNQKSEILEDLTGKDII